MLAAERDAAQARAAIAEAQVAVLTTAIISLQMQDQRLEGTSLPAITTPRPCRREVTITHPIELPPAEQITVLYRPIVVTSGQLLSIFA